MTYNYEGPNYRIYALIIGEIIEPGDFFEWQIKNIAFAEQTQRNFSPIQSTFSEVNDQESYATFLPYIDPVRIKSEYALICDVKEDDPRAALGGAIRRVDRICRFLSIAYSEDFKNKFSRDRSLIPYLYQVNKIYALDENGNESQIDFKFESGYIYLPDRPELGAWRHPETKKFLKDIFYFNDAILERAVKYLYRSSIGRFVNDSPEKIALDYIKSMEIIINTLSNKRAFEKRLDEAAIRIGLSDDEKEKIKKCWDDRSKYSDTAHPAPFDQAERYPNQFPLPSNVQYPHRLSGAIAVNVCTKYFLYKRSLFRIDIDEPFDNEEERLGEVNAQWESNHLFFQTKEKNKEALKKKIAEHFAREYQIQESDVFDVALAPGKKIITLRVRDNTNLHTPTLRVSKVVIRP